jgi:tetratricopeptide (TPR) repeat protein
MKLRAVLIALTVCAAPAVLPHASARAQTPAEHIAAGDKDRNMEPAGALKHFEAALAAEPNNYEALYKAADAAVQAGQLATDQEAGRALYKKAEAYARRAVQVNPNDAEGHFQLARAIGRNAQTMGSRDRVKFGGVVRAEALEALRLDPKHDGALHVMGEWNAEVMRLSGIARFMAKNFLGGRVFDSANWDDAQRYLEEAVQIAPTRLVHRIDLAQVYVDRNNKAKAREQVDYILKAPVLEASDTKYKRDAEALQAKLR